MDFNGFIKSLNESRPTGNIGGPLLALWYDGAGNWDKAHQIVQDDNGTDAAWVHAYLHRKEGDDWNARYWYRRAGKDPYKLSLKEEWTHLVKTLI